VGRAPLQKGKFTWITEAGRQERWIVASCGAYTVLWNFRWGGLADGGRTSIALTFVSSASGSSSAGHQPSCDCQCRQVKLAESAVQSYGGLTTVTEYHLIPRQEDVVDSTFMHDNYASPGARWVAQRCTWPKGPSYMYCTATFRQCQAWCTRSSPSVPCQPCRITQHAHFPECCHICSDHTVWSRNPNRAGAAEDAMVVFTKHRVWSLADEDSDN
jgi:hypothetical protein